MTDSARPSKRHMGYIDVLNVMAALAVVVLHCNGCFWEGPAQGRSWVTANAIETLFYWPVPVFFMISGATLMDYRDRMDTGAYLKRRFWRTVVPFLVWSMIGLAYQLLLSVRASAPLDLSPLAIASGILNTQYVSVYWFFPPLFAVYLSIPILSAVGEREEVFTYMVAVGTVFVGVLPLTCAILSIPWNQSLTPPPVMGCMIYAVLGWLLSHKAIGQRQRYLLYALAIIGWLVQMLGTLALSTPELGVSKTFKSYLYLPAILQATGVFVFVRYACSHHSKAADGITSLCKGIAPYTFGVYLTHWYVLDLVGRIGLVDAHSILWRTLGALAVFTLCASLTWVYKRMVSALRSSPLLAQ